LIFAFFIVFGDNTDNNSRDGSGIDNLEAESKRDMKIERKKRLNWQQEVRQMSGG